MKYNLTDGVIGLVVGVVLIIVFRWGYGFIQTYNGYEDKFSKIEYDIRKMYQEMSGLNKSINQDTTLWKCDDGTIRNSVGIDELEGGKCLQIRVEIE